jgi:hypothetical protein
MMFKLAKRKRGTTSLALLRRTPFLRLTMVAGIWLLLGIFILVWMRLSGNESWLSKAADIIEEREESQAVESK